MFSIHYMFSISLSYSIADTLAEKSALQVTDRGDQGKSAGADRVFTGRFLLKANMRGGNPHLIQWITYPRRVD